MVPQKKKRRKKKDNEPIEGLGGVFLSSQTIPLHKASLLKDQLECKRTV